MPTTSADQRILKGVAATLRWQPIDSDGTAADPGGTVTVDIARADGTALITGGSTAGATDAERTYSLAAASNTLLDVLTVTWKVGGVARATTTVEVVGGYYASIAEIRSAVQSLNSTTEFPDALVLRARWEVEAEFERITDRAFVPRFYAGRFSGSGTSRQLLRHYQLRSTRFVRSYTDGTNYTASSSGDLAAIPADDAGIANRVDGGIFEPGHGNLLIGYEHGYDRPPAEVRRVFLVRLRNVLASTKSGVPDRATTFTQAGGGTFSLATPGSSWYETGLPEVDAVLQRYPARSGIA